MMTAKANDDDDEVYVEYQSPAEPADRTGKDSVTPGRTHQHPVTNGAETARTR